MDVKNGPARGYFSTKAVDVKNGPAGGRGPDNKNPPVTPPPPPSPSLFLILIFSSKMVCFGARRNKNANRRVDFNSTIWMGRFPRGFINKN